MMLDNNHLRIRNNTRIKNLNIPKEKVQRLENMLSSKDYRTDKNKHHLIKNVTGKSPCCICRTGIPSVELTYSAGPMKGVVEFYCSSCIEKTFQRIENEPKNKEEIPEFYNCIKGDWH